MPRQKAGEPYQKYLQEALPRIWQAAQCLSLCPRPPVIPLLSSSFSSYQALLSIPMGVYAYYTYRGMGLSRYKKNSHSDCFFCPQSKRYILHFVYFMFAKRSTAFVKLSMVFSASPCSIPSRTQCLICPSNTTCPHLCRADFAALIWERMSSHGISSSTIRSIACICPSILASLRCRFSASIHCLIVSPPYTVRGIWILYLPLYVLSSLYTDQDSGLSRAGQAEGNHQKPY